jgi:hypothetical protein
MPFRLLLFGVLAVFALPLVAGPMTKIKVEVKDLQGKPVERASVTVTFREGAQIMKLGKSKYTTWELKTNQEGVAKLPAVPQGKIRIVVSAPKYQTFGEMYDVKDEDKTVAVTLNPPQQQYSAHQ